MRSLFQRPCGLQEVLLDAGWFIDPRLPVPLVFRMGLLRGLIVADSAGMGQNLPSGEFQEIVELVVVGLLTCRFPSV